MKDLKQRLINEYSNTKQDYAIFMWDGNELQFTIKNITETDAKLIEDVLTDFNFECTNNSRVILTSEIQRHYDKEDLDNEQLSELKKYGIEF